MEKFVPKKNEKEVISIRIPTDLLFEIDSLAAKIGISRNEFINQSIIFAIANMDQERRNC